MGSAFASLQRLTLILYSPCRLQWVCCNDDTSIDVSEEKQIETEENERDHDLFRRLQSEDGIWHDVSLR